MNSKDDINRECVKRILESLNSLKTAVNVGNCIDVPVEHIFVCSIYLRKQHQEIKEHNQPTVPQTDVIDANATNNTEPSVMSRTDIVKYAKLNPVHGRKLTVDNIDIQQATHDMTEEHQNPDAHYCTLMSTENRVSGGYLSHDKPIGTLHELENATFCPSKYEHIKQRENYITLVGSVVTDSIPCLN